MAGEAQPQGISPADSICLKGSSRLKEILISVSNGRELRISSGRGYTGLSELGGHKGVWNSTLYSLLCIQNISWHVSCRELISSEGDCFNHFMNHMLISALLARPCVFCLT